MMYKTGPGDQKKKRRREMKEKRKVGRKQEKKKMNSEHGKSGKRRKEERKSTWTHKEGQKIPTLTLIIHPSKRRSLSVEWGNKGRKVGTTNTHGSQPECRMAPNSALVELFSALCRFKSKGWTKAPLEKTCKKEK